jgi:hypothetical protein
VVDVRMTLEIWTVAVAGSEQLATFRSAPCLQNWELNKSVFFVSYPALETSS